MRSVHSILDRTDHNHLKEIILIDDYSDLEDLHDNVNKAVNEINKQIHLDVEMLETNNIDMDNAIVDYINDDEIPPKNGEQTTSKLAKNGFNIRLLKTKTREGLIRARLFGAENSIGDVSITPIYIQQLLL